MSEEEKYDGLLNEMHKVVQLETTQDIGEGTEERWSVLGERYGAFRTRSMVYNFSGGRNRWHDRWPGLDGLLTQSGQMSTSKCKQPLFGFES